MILVGLAVLVAGFGYYLLFSNSDEGLQQDNLAKISEEAGDAGLAEKINGPTQGVGTFANLQLLNQDLECDISYYRQYQGSVIEGKYFVSEGKIRGDFLSDAPDLSSKIPSSIIIDDTTIYTWSKIDGKYYGVKSTVGADDDVVSNEGVVSLNQGISYECKSWPAVNLEIFTPPSDVLFRDMNTMMNSDMEYGTVYKDEKSIE